MPPNATRAPDHLVVIGAGGHAKVCVEILHGTESRVLVCIVSEDLPPARQRDGLGLSVLVGLSRLNRLRREAISNLFVPIGDNCAQLPARRDL